jgi:hypothetical protein
MTLIVYLPGAGLGVNIYNALVKEKVPAAGVSI